jgi:hypothetical protein
MFRWFSNKSADTNIKTDDAEVKELDMKELKDSVKCLTERVTQLKTDLESKPDVILYYDGTLYVGGVNKDEHGYNRPHGYGTICHVMGTRYIGEWKDGLYHGKGIFYQDYYTPPFSAEWVNHIPHGKLTWDGIHFDTYENGIKSLQ